MHTWKLKNAQHRLRELVRLALTKEPQRLSNGKDAVVVIAASEYARLVAAAGPNQSGATKIAAATPEKPNAGAIAERTSAWTWFEQMRKKHGFDEEGWLYEWDDEKREWIIPEEYRALSA
jgi:hypothetical protein